MITKICSKCKIEKPISEFNKTKNSKDKLTYSCKKCQKKYQKEYRRDTEKYCKKPEVEILDNSIIGELERICKGGIGIRTCRQSKASKNIVFYEEKVGEYFKEKGFIVLKNGYPDFLIIDPTNKFGMFVEVKNRFDKIKENQKEYHKYLKMFGFSVNIIKNKKIEEINIEKLQKFFIPVKQLEQ